MRGLAAFAALCSPLLCITAENPLTGACQDQAEEEAKSITSQLLQHQHSLYYASQEESEPTKNLPLPITWMHLPRSGSSFAYTLLQAEGVCDWGMALDDRGDLVFDVRSVLDHCPGLAVPLSPSGCSPESDLLRCTEQGISTDWSRREGSVVAMFRQPEERLMSEWNWEIRLGHHFPSITDFVHARQGCATKILTGSITLENHCEDGDPPSWEQVTLAKTRLRTGFAFIGMTAKWSLSICLFNTMFGTPCHASQFSLYHTLPLSDSSNVTALNGFVDKYDGPLWDIAQRKFEYQLDRYGVSEGTCVPCTD